MMPTEVNVMEHSGHGLDIEPTTAADEMVLNITDDMFIGSQSPFVDTVNGEDVAMDNVSATDMDGSIETVEVDLVCNNEESYQNTIEEVVPAPEPEHSSNAVDEGTVASDDGECSVTCRNNKFDTVNGEDIIMEKVPETNMNGSVETVEVDLVCNNEEAVPAPEPEHSSNTVDEGTVANDDGECSVTCRNNKFDTVNGEDIIMEKVPETNMNGSVETVEVDLVCNNEEAVSAPEPEHSSNTVDEGTVTSDDGESSVTCPNYKFDTVNGEDITMEKVPETNMNGSIESVEVDLVCNNEEAVSAPEPEHSSNTVDEGTGAINDGESSVTCPDYKFDNFIEITNSVKPFGVNSFLVGCKWSPDGTCLITNCVDFTIRLFDLPKQLYNKKCWNRNNDLFPELEPSLTIKEGGQIYDYDWYPFMSSWYPDTCSFLATSSKAPIHLWDAYSGKIIATYRGYNRVDETDNAYSVKFSLNAEKIYSGYKNEIKVFNTSYPGRDYVNINTKFVAGQTGIISCIAENPAIPNMFAAGSYKRTIGLYLESGDSVCLLNGQRCGITQLLWSQDGIHLYSGARKDNEILCWDLRNPGQLLAIMERTVDTNQRIYFDITPDGKYLISGGTDGEVYVWDLHDNVDDFGKRKLLTKHKVHADCANGLSIHRQIPILATSSGQHHYPDLASDDEDSKIFDSTKMISRIENSVKLWWIGSINDETL